MRLFGREISLSVTKAAPAGTVPVRSPGGLLGWVREPYAGAWQQGVTVDPIGSITSFGAVFACISRIATDIAKLELTLLVDENGIPKLAGLESPFWRTLKRPNAYQNRIQFLIFWLACKLLFGNAYAMKIRQDARGMVTQLVLLDPRRVTPMVTPEGDVYYSIGGDDLAKIPAGGVMPASEIIHDRGLTLWHPLVGVAPIYACGISATQGARIQANSATFFQNMSRPSGMLSAPGTIDETTAARLKEQWESNYGGMNIGRLAVLGDGLTYEAMTIPAEQAQLIEQLNWTVEDVARCFGVPLYKINAGAVPTAGNVEALESQYYSGCLQVLIESIELCLTEGLELKPGMHVELNLDGLLRMDSATQVDMLAKAVGGAIMKPNEARRRRRLDPVAGGDTVYLQQQNYSLEALAKRDAREDPFGTAKPAAPASEPPAPEPDDDVENDDNSKAALAAVHKLLEALPGALKGALAECAPVATQAADADEIAEAFKGLAADDLSLETLCG